ncbi:MAG: hypothetical protein H7A45_00955 [Verrucomicrobiales bacterium]|nr:hypothetical protein [Verrucomicrobiales bacterium]
MANILIVLDGGFRFSAAGGIPDFTFQTLVEALSSAGHSVTKAHRQSDPSADHASFSFASSLDLLAFDVLWLIGHEGRNVSGSSAQLPDAELAAIARFAAAGGGVFATGDHDSIGSNMCGHIPRVRAMRAWYGTGDAVSPMPAGFPRNFPPLGTGRADTTRQNPGGDYDLNDDGTNEAFVWFENQSDAVPQPITPVPPVHPILKRGVSDITVFPDHMHEGNTLGEVPGYPYDTAAATFAGETFPEFPMVDGHRELPRVIATGQTVSLASKMASGGGDLDTSIPAPKTVNTLCAYDGRTVGVGRVVTDSTWHHYIDINLTGDSRIDTPAESALTGPGAAKNHGFNDAPAVFDDIRAVFVNIANWLARPRPKIQLILERSTFSQAEAAADPSFAGAMLVTVDGLKPNQFPGGGISSLSPDPAQLAAWAPVLTPLEPAGLSLVPTGVASDDPGLNDRLQRITFIYRVVANPAAFGFAGDFNHVQVDASLTSPAAAAPLTDSAQITLVKSANPFMLDLANGNPTPWLSSDVRVFPVVAGAPGSPLPNGATRAQALAHLQTRLNAMTVAEFEALPTGQSASALSPFPTTTGSPSRRVYNFAVARVRLPSSGAAATNVRVFFRIFTSQTTAALTYRESPPGTPVRGYKKTAGANPIALPGTNAAGTEWLSFPMFAATRAASPNAQSDPVNVKPNMAPGTSAFFGCLVDNNLDDDYLPPTPAGGAATDLPTLMMSEHQCIVAQIEFPGTPIPDGANPFTSDKLSQRNIALSAIANPGLDASRRAFHTFEIEAAPGAISDELPPDELLLDWRADPPRGAEVRLFIPGWDASEVVALADRFYPRHEIRVIDPHTVAVPGGGVRYVPVPRSQSPRTGVITADFPLGVKRGQRFDLAVRQVTNRSRQVEVKPSNLKLISAQEAARLLERRRAGKSDAETGAGPDKQGAVRGVFDLGQNTVLMTDLGVINAPGGEALIIQHPAPEEVAAARRGTGRWRETIGAFQLGIPVSVKAEMLAHHLRLLSVLRWRAEWLRPDSRWYDAFIRFVQLTAEKVRALGGNPDLVPATPDGGIPLPEQAPDHDGHGGAGEGGDPCDRCCEPAGEPGPGDPDGDERPDAARPGMWSGKVSELVFDHFGDFEGFTIEGYDGSRRRFFSREAAILELVEKASTTRLVVAVITTRPGSRQVRRILIQPAA